MEDFRQHLKANPRLYRDDDIRDVFKVIVQRCCAVKGDDLGHTAADLSHIFRSATRKRMFVYPAIRQGLKTLREKYRLGIVSNAQEAFTPEELDVYGLREHFDVIVLSSQVKLKKPNPAIFHAALEKIGVGASETVFVGNDLAADIMGASALGMKTILIGRPGYSITGVAPDANIPGTDIGEIIRIIGNW
jgi:putative hydrolase of the HAD superfamily